MTNAERIAWVRRITQELAVLPDEERALVLEMMRLHLDRERSKNRPDPAEHP